MKCSSNLHQQCWRWGDLHGIIKCPHVSLLGFLILREVKDQAQPAEKAGEKLLEEMRNLRGKALNTYLILE